jgi:hypothetical protein
MRLVRQSIDQRLAQLARETLAGIGTELFRLWLAPQWEKLAKALRPGEPRMLVIASGLSSMLNLPWELLNVARQSGWKRASIRMKTATTLGKHDCRG